MIPLDLTHQALATEEIQRRLLSADRTKASAWGEPTIRPLFHDILVYFASTYRDIFGLVDGPPLHDPIAVAAILGDSDIRFDDAGHERWNVDVVTDGSHSKLDEERGQVGRTVITKADGDGVRIPKSFATNRFWDTIEACLQRAEEATSGG